MRKILAAAILVSFLLFVPGQSSAVVLAQSQEEQDIDVFMKEVIEKRKTDWDTLYNYVFREREVFRFSGKLEEAAIESFEREWTWYVRDGYLVRSPVSFNGVSVPQDEREKYELDWIKKAKSRKKDTGVHRDDFFGIKYEPGNYYVKGREVVDGKELLVVEYYPEVVTEDGDSDDEDFDEEMEKVLGFTMYINVEDHQIVKMVLHNTKMDFLPGGWLLKVKGVKASMMMGKPFDENWMPLHIEAGASFTMASGDISFLYRTEYSEYQKAKVKVNFRFAPKDK